MSKLFQICPICGTQGEIQDYDFCQVCGWEWASEEIRSSTPVPVERAVEQRVQRTNATEPFCAIARECYFGQDNKCLRGGICR